MTRNISLIVLILCVFQVGGLHAATRPVSPASDDDLLYGESISIGLDRNLRHSPEEGTTRKVLIEQMRVLLSRPDREEKITSAEIRKYYLSHRDRFRVPSQMSFRQVFFTFPRAQADLKAKNLLSDLHSGALPWSKIEKRSDPFPLGLEFRVVSEDLVSRRFGARFSASLSKLKLNQWGGPIASPLGLHLIRIEKRFSATIAPISTVRLTIIAAISKEHAARRLQHAIDRLRKNTFRTRTDG